MAIFKANRMDWLVGAKSEMTEDYFRYKISIPCNMSVVENISPIIPQSLNNKKKKDMYSPVTVTERTEIMIHKYSRDARLPAVWLMIRSLSVTGN